MRAAMMKTNFTAGELSPRLYGRSDIDRYNNGAKVLLNVFVLVQGGVIGRYGLRFTQPAKHGDKHGVLIPYVFNRDQAYMLEVGDAYIRVYLQNGAQVQTETSPGVFTPYEIQSDYAEADLDSIDYVQSGDTMFLFHVDYPTRRLRRFGNAAWVLEDVPWVNLPYAEVGTRPAASLTLDSLALGPGRTLTASAGAFMASDVGREIETEGGLALITAFTSGTVVIADVLTPFPSLVIADGDWLITGSPYATLTPTWPAGSGTDLPAVGAAITLTLGQAGWRAEDVGKWVDINAGLIQITAVSSSTVATGELRRVMSALVASPALAWTLMGSAWGGKNGYPRTGTFFEQRLWCAGSRMFPQTVWGSRIGEYLDFELGAESDDAMSLSAASEQQHTITHLTGLGALVTLSNGGETTIRGTDDSAIAPNAKNKIKPQSNFGCSIVSPERIGGELLFVQRGGRKIRALSADKIDSDQFGAPDMTVLAEHITRAGVAGLAYQAEPDPLLFTLMADGQLAVLTFDRDQDVIGWARQSTQGRFDAVATLPTETGDQVWAIVIREVGGQQVRYVERFDPSLNTDSAITGVDPAGSTVWTGLAHLEGMTVKVKADGVELQDRVVSGGEITLERAAKTVEIGLQYVSRVEMLRPEVQTQEGTSQGGSVRISEVTCRFLETIGATVNGQLIFGRPLGLGVLDKPPQPFTGDVPVETLGWGRGDFHVVVEQKQPYPFHLQAVISTTTVNAK
ncbi:MAG: hypothetical protein ACREPD_04975 [Stenotrophomonas sp.]|uniref:hypothetical protein n=1 Tax=Stenotrophomonas sp. TaxID=69392 RepID=UPI003D6CC3F1